MLEKFKDVVNKLDMGMKYFILIMFGISLIYVIFTSIFGKNEKKNQLAYDDAQKFVNIYLEQESADSNEYLVHDYNEYYTIKSAIDNFIGAYSKGNTREIYGILDKTLKAQYSQKEFDELLKGIEDDLVSNYEDVGYVKEVYSLGNYQYICNLKYNDFTATLGVRLNIDDNTYNIFYIKIGD